MQKTVAIFFVLTLCATAADWPQYLGPARNNLSTEQEWDRTLSRKDSLWTAEVGGGRSSPAVADGACYTLGKASGNSEIVTCLDAATGKVRWAYSYDLSRGKAHAISTPTVTDDSVYVYGSTGILSCLERETGTLRWRRDFAEELDIKPPGHGIASSPLVLNGKVIIPTMRSIPEEEREAYIASRPEHYKHKDAYQKDLLGDMRAVDAVTGRDLWVNDIDGAGQFSSPIAGVIDGKLTLVYHSGRAVLGLDPETGKRWWVFDLKANRASPVVVKEVNGKKVERRKPLYASIASTPIIVDEERFLVPTMISVPVLIRVKDGKAELVWMAKGEAGSWFLSPAVYKDMVLYSGTGTNSGYLACVSLADGSLLWDTVDYVDDKKKYNGGSLAIAGGTLLFRSGKGGKDQLVSADIKRDGFQVLGSIEADSKPGGGWKLYATPTVANGRLYMREAGILTCYDVSK